MRDEQSELDREDAVLRLGSLVDLIHADQVARDAVRQAEHNLRIARARLKTAQRNLSERAFMEKCRRRRE